MPEYLSKEEVRQWRSSLEKITLEEFAARLGKVINEEKETRDIVDIVLEKEPVLVHENYKIKTEKIASIAQKSFRKEREITTVKHESLLDSVKPITEKAADKVKVEIKPEIQESKTEAKKEKKPLKIKKEKPIKVEVKTVEVKEVKVEKATEKPSTKVKVTFKKPLTEREQMVFNHFLSHKNSIVYAKDLAALLDLPRDYVYKYIKNLRNKINEADALENASNGGYILKA